MNSINSINATKKKLRLKFKSQRKHRKSCSSIKLPADLLVLEECFQFLVPFCAILKYLPVWYWYFIKSTLNFSANVSVSLRFALYLKFICDISWGLSIYCKLLAASQGNKSKVAIIKFIVLHFIIKTLKFAEWNA